MKKTVARCGGLAAFLLVCAVSGRAEANDAVNWHGGPMENLTIDLIFWGNPTFTFDGNDSAGIDVLDYVRSFVDYLNGLDDPAGYQPAARWYGVQGAVVGNWIVDTRPVSPGYLNGTVLFTDDSIKTEMLLAQNGSLGPSFDRSGNSYPAGLPSGQTNRLALVITRGITIAAPPDLPFETENTNVCGWHNYSSQPYGIADLGCDWEDTVSHETLEASLDPSRWDGWATDVVFGLGHYEAADSCGAFRPPAAPQFVDEFGDISGISGITLDSWYAGMNNVTSDTCQIWVPEQYSPITTTINTNGGGANLDVFYRTQTNRLNSVRYNLGQGTWSAPVDNGIPAPGVTIAGKPTAISSHVDGERVFVRASNNALWQYDNLGQWTNLGGIILGDPSAALWFNNNVDTINVFAEGTDNYIWTKTIAGGVPIGGWVQVPTGHGIGTPKAISKDGLSIDLFSTDNNAGLFWMSFSKGAWKGPTHSGVAGEPSVVATVGVASLATNRLDFVMSASAPNFGGVVSQSITNQAWTAARQRLELSGTNFMNGEPGIAVTSPGRLDVATIDNTNRLWHSKYTMDINTWTGDLNPLATDATGDPVVVAYFRNNVRMFSILYRAFDGSLKQLEWNGSRWLASATRAPAGSVH